MPKFCACGSPRCPICNPRKPPVSQRKFSRPPSVTQNASVPVSLPVESKQNATVAPPQNASVPVIGRVLAVSVDGVYGVPCACGCDKMVKVGPVYFSAACRAKVWRKKKA